MPRRTRAWIVGGWVVFALVLAGLVGYLVHVGLDKADKLASVIGAVIAILAAGLPYLFPSRADTPQPAPVTDVLEGTGKATATGGGTANTGLDTPEAVPGSPERPVVVRDTGDARANGQGSIANTGIIRRPR